MTGREVIVVETIDELIRRQACERPERTGLVFEGRSFSYREMNEAANRAANALVSLGVKKGDRVVWIAQNIAQFWHALFGAAKIGAVMTPVNWRLAPAEIAQIVEDSS